MERAAALQAKNHQTIGALRHGVGACRPSAEVVCVVLVS